MRTRSWVLLLLLAVTLLASIPPAAGSEPARELAVYALSDDDGQTFTVFQRVEHVGGVDSAAVPVPVAYASIEVRDQNGSVLHWAETEAGRLHIAAPNGTTHYHITIRGIPGPTRSSLSVPDDPGRLIVALPAALEPEDLTRVSREDLQHEAPYSDWPLPHDRSYWAGEPSPGTQSQVHFQETDGVRPAPYALLAVLLVLLGLTTVWLMVRVHKSTADPTRPREMPILEHLEELRRRLMWVVGVLFAGAFFFFTFGFRWVSLAGYRLPVPVPSLYDNAAAQVFTWMSRHVVPPNVQVVVVSPWDAVVTQITLSIALAVLVAFPVLFYHLYAYLAPALYPKERRAVFLTVPVVVVLFALGAAFGVGLMLPFLVRVLYGFAGTLGAVAFLNVPDLVALGALNAVVFGLAFELPVVMALLSAIGVVEAASWRRHWRGALVAIVIIAAFVTDPTIITQLIVAAVLSTLYAIGVLLAMVFEKKAAELGEARPVAQADRS